MLTFNVEEYIVSQRTQLEKELVLVREKIQNTVEGTNLLSANGFRTTNISNSYDAKYPGYFIIDPKDFQKIHKALGPLVNAGVEPASDDGRKRLVRITLRPKDKKFSHFTFSLEKRLPKPNKVKGVQPKCRFVTKMVRQTRLVCQS